MPTFGIHTIDVNGDPYDISHTGLIYYPKETIPNYESLPKQVLHFGNGSMVLNNLDEPDICVGTFDDYLEDVLHQYRIANADEPLVAYWDGTKYTDQLVPHARFWPSEA
jgi:hypothetical protein